MSWLVESLNWPNAGWQGFSAHLLLQVTVIAVIALFCNSVVRNAWGSAPRHAILMAALLGLALCPFIVGACHVAGLEIPIPITKRTRHDSEATVERSTSLVEPAGPEQTQQEDGSLRNTASSTTKSGSSTSSVSSAMPVREDIPSLVLTMPILLLSFWTVGAIAGIVRFCVGLLWIRRTIRDSTSVQLPNAVLESLNTAFGKDAIPTVRESNLVPVPMLAGVWSPVILLPKGLSLQVSEQELSSLVVHEYAHAYRRDCLTGWLQRLIGIVYWFHPLVHILNRRLSATREEICDNYVLRVSKPTNYANLLLHLGENASVSTPAAAMPLHVSAWKLEDRVRGLLNPKRDRKTSAGRAISCYTAAVATLCLVMSSARLIAVESVTSNAEDTILDLYGDPVPHGAILRLGTERFRPLGDGSQRKITFTQTDELVTVSQDGRLEWWDSTSGKSLRRVRLDFDTRGFATAPDYSTFAVAYFKYRGSDPVSENGVKIIDTSTGVVKHTIRYENHQDDAKLIFSPDGNNLIYANHGRIRIIGTASGLELLKFDLAEEPRIECVAVSSDGKQIAGAFRDKIFVLNWLSEEDPHLIAGFPHINAMEFTPDCKGLVFWRDGSDEQGVELFDIEREEVTRVFQAEESEQFWTRSLLIGSKKSKLFAANHDDGILYGWNIQTGELLHRHQLPQWRPSTIAWNKSQNLLAASSDGLLHVFDAETFRPICERDYQAHSAIVTGVRFVANGNRLVTSSDDRTARIWDAQTGEMLDRLEHGKWIRGLAVSPDSKWIATSSLDNTVRLTDAETMEPTFELPGHGNLGGHRQLTFSPDSKSLASVGDDPYLRIWDVMTGKTVLETELKPGGLPLHSGDGRFGARIHCTFSRDATKLFVLKNQAAFVFDAKTGKELRQVRAKSTMRSGAFDADGSRLLVSRAAEDAKRIPLKNGGVHFASPNKYAASMMDWESGEEAWAFEATGFPGPMAFSPNGKIVVYTARDYETHDRIFALDASDGKLLGKIDVSKISWGFGDARIDISKDGRLAIPLQDGSVLVWNLKEIGAWK